MKESHVNTMPVRHSQPAPGLTRLTRRQLLARLTGAAAVAALGAGGVLWRDSSSRTSNGARRRIPMPPHPSHNPAFRVLASPGDELVLWTHKADASFAGYRLNAQGKRLWMLCNGTRTVPEIVAEYGGAGSGRRAEAGEFLQELMKAGLIVCGGYIVVGEPLTSSPKTV